MCRYRVCTGRHYTAGTMSRVKVIVVVVVVVASCVIIITCVVCIGYIIIYEIRVTRFLSDDTIDICSMGRRRGVGKSRRKKNVSAVIGCNYVYDNPHLLRA